MSLKCINDVFFSAYTDTEKRQGVANFMANQINSIYKNCGIDVQSDLTSSSVSLSLFFLSLLFFLIISFYTHTSFLLLELEILGWLDSASKIHFIPMAPLCSLEIKGGMKFLRFFLPSLLFAFCVSLLSV